ncbi:hypothetical protein LCGC14_1899230 [marine sediment metagenome]|uniref:Uncharacterized protein n=1 Tax=marine sediment metagenome TaxID=412755 RepID=A0A0F9IB01_9ZZZZ
MKLDKLEAVHKTLENMGRRVLTNDFDVRTFITGIIVILKEMTEFEIEKFKYELKKQESESLYL